ncbi:MAG: Glycerophosphocholine phosphodiesterase [Bogoriella megaspora]|nr:MAG: Glycerophosphocholine phosphodiesterase [Bogoriella megaspora]
MDSTYWKLCFSVLRKIGRSMSALDIAITSDYPQSHRRSLHFYSHLADVFPAAYLEALREAIDNDDASILGDALSETTLPTESRKQVLLPSLLCSLSYRSLDCLMLLLERSNKLNNDFLIDGNILHQLVTKSGQKGMAITQNLLPFHPWEDLSSVEFFKSMLTRLQHHRQPLVWMTDSLGRLPIHYAALYGLAKICQLLLDDMSARHVQAVLASDLVSDLEGNTPLYHAVVGGHVQTVKVLLDWRSSEDQNTTASLLSGELLAVALESRFDDIADLLLNAGTDMTHRNAAGETLLHVAIRSKHAQSVKRLLQYTPHRSSQVDVPETSYERTPLLVASMQGSLLIVEHLIEAGADITVVDYIGWSASELAAYRGHIAVVKRLEAAKAEIIKSSRSQTSHGLNVQTLGFVETSRKFSKAALELEDSTKPYDEPQVFVNLGCLDTRKHSPAVNFESYNNLDGISRKTLTVFSLEISSADSTDPLYKIHLPVLDDTTNKPFRFSVRDAGNIKLQFKVYYLDNLVGNGIAMLDHPNQDLRPARESLVRDFTVAILELETSRFIGTVTCTAVVARPARVAPPTRQVTDHFWSNVSSTKVVGHRGSGQNMASHGHLQIGENSLQARLSLHRASAVEFDVQLTRDHVPVIYHDFLVSESGTDAPVHTLDFEQFMFLSELQTNPTRSTDNVRENSSLSGDKRASFPGANSLPSDLYGKLRVQNFVSRMEHTFEYKLKGFKGNTRGRFIHEAFLSLEQLLLQLPQSIPFDIEIKYPMLWETTDYKMDPSAIELNVFLDTILDKIYTHGGNRAIALTSFSPEICMVLSAKQKRFPIYFLNDAGLCPTGDSRASSMQDAVHFAKSWNLEGIVMASEPLVFCPRLIRFAQSHNLFCASYGDLNNDPESAKIQADAGLDAIVVDRYTKDEENDLEQNTHTSQKAFGEFGKCEEMKY